VSSKVLLLVEVSFLVENILRSFHHRKLIGIIEVPYRADY
jgi:hypothetical protein